MEYKYRRGAAIAPHLTLPPQFVQFRTTADSREPIEGVSTRESNTNSTYREACVKNPLKGANVSFRPVRDRKRLILVAVQSKEH